MRRHDSTSGEMEDAPDLTPAVDSANQDPAATAKARHVKIPPPNQASNGIKRNSISPQPAGGKQSRPQSATRGSTAPVRYFILKSYNRENVERSIDQGVWSTQVSTQSTELMCMCVMLCARYARVVVGTETEILACWCCLEVHLQCSFPDHMSLCICACNWLQASHKTLSTVRLPKQSWEPDIFAKLLLHTTDEQACYAYVQLPPTCLCKHAVMPPSHKCLAFCRSTMNRSCVRHLINLRMCS